MFGSKGSHESDNCFGSDFHCPSPPSPALIPSPNALNENYENTFLRTFGGRRKKTVVKSFHSEEIKDSGYAVINFLNLVLFKSDAD